MPGLERSSLFLIMVLIGTFTRSQIYRVSSVYSIGDHLRNQFGFTVTLFSIISASISAHYLSMIVFSVLNI